MTYLLLILLLVLGCNNNSTDPGNDFYIEDVNILLDGISSTSNIYIKFSAPIDTDSFTLLNETVSGPDGEIIELDFTYALKEFGQNSSDITLNGISCNFWYDSSTNTIAIITTNTLENIDDGLLNEDGNILFISKLISDEDGNTLSSNHEYSINKDSQVNVNITPNPVDVQSLTSSGGEGSGVEFHMSGVPEEYVINIYDMNDNLINSQDNNHNHAELSTYAEWKEIQTDGNEFFPGIYKFELYHNDSLQMRSVIVVSH